MQMRHEPAQYWMSAPRGRCGDRGGDEVAVRRVRGPQLRVAASRATRLVLVEHVLCRRRATRRLPAQYRGASAVSQALRHQPGSVDPLHSTLGAGPFREEGWSLPRCGRSIASFFVVMRDITTFITWEFGPSRCISRGDLDHHDEYHVGAQEKKCRSVFPIISVLLLGLVKIGPGRKRGRFLSGGSVVSVA